MYKYQAFHLNITMPFECSQLLEASEASNHFPNVSVSFANVPEQLDSPLYVGPAFEATNEEFLLKIEGVGRYLIRQGNEIIIEPHPDVTEEEIRLFLLGSAFGALLNQRGYLVLHASAICTPKGAVLFTGHSGAGKSTTVQAFIEKGYTKLSDDTVALYYDAESKKTMVIPSFPNTKLWQKSADVLGKDTTGLARIRPNVEKFNLSTKEHFHNELTELHAIYELTPLSQSDKLSLAALTTIDKFKLLFSHTYRRRYAENLLCKQNHFQISTQIAQKKMIKKLKRPANKNTLTDLVQLLEADFTS
jgi:hypothetical protein